MTIVNLYPRHAASLLGEALEDAPVALIHGPRQCGKTTLAQMTCKPLSYEYVTFDDDAAHAAAEADPAGFVAELPERVILDEVQRVPAIFTALKLQVDRSRVPGRFVLTGSTNVMLLPNLADSLAGRMQVVRLHPLSQCELQRHRPVFLDALFAGAFGTRRVARLGSADLAARIVGGGFPAALARPPGRRRSNWHNDYADALVQRDVRHLARIHGLEAMPRLLTAAATQTARLFNLESMASRFQLSRPTIAGYLALLERVFLFERLRPWHTNRLRRLVKAPKLHFVDTGLACALLGVNTCTLAADRELLGLMLETFIYQELRRQAICQEVRPVFHHFRDRDGLEVDIVIERGGYVAGVEVKAAGTVRDGDFRGLRKLRSALGERFAGGVVLYDGEICASFGERLHAVPLRMTWDSTIPNEPS